MITLQTAIIFQILIIQVLTQWDCPQNSSFSPQFYQCICNQSYFQDFYINQCQLCQTNSTSSQPQYVQWMNSLSCDLCLPNFYYNEKNSQVHVDRNQVPVCIECPQGSGTNQANIDNFQISSCSICLQNYYMTNPSSQSPTLNSAQCLPCPNGTLSSGAQTVDQSVCNSCAINYYMAQSSIAASQNNNNQGVAAQCLVCPQGSGTLEDLNIQGDISQCSICLENYFMVSPAIQSAQGIQPSAAQCISCPNNSYNPKNSQQGYCTCYDSNATPLSSQVQSCNCKNGYYGSVATSQNAPSGCFPCPQGQYSNSQTQHNCQTCPSKFVTNLDQSGCVCNVAGLGVILDQSTNNCTCKNGYQEDISSLSGCSSCPQGFYSNSSTSFKCISCPSGSQTNNDQSNCICNDNSLAVYFDPISISCKCQKDYFGNPSQATLATIGSCTPCPTKFQATFSQNEIMKSQCVFSTFQNFISFSLVLAAIQLCILL